MARVLDRQKAIDLRKKGRTYSEIRKELDIAKSTLSDWLRKYPLTMEQIMVLEKNKRQRRSLAIEKTRITKQKKRESRILEIYKEQQKQWTDLDKRELELAGIFLYWGEGNKRLNGPVSINNTDPEVIKFTLYWFQFGLGVTQERIKVYLHLYSDMNLKEEMEFWSKELNLPLCQFLKPYIKKSKRAEIDQRGFGHGTCGLMVNNVRLKEKIMMTIKALADYYSDKIEAMIY